MKIRIKRIRKLKLPLYQHSDDSGMDLVNAGEDFILKHGRIKLVPAGIRVEIPEGFEIQIRPRSGMAVKHGITVLNTPGTVDAGYRGEVKVLLINLGDSAVEIKKGKRIAQAVLMKVEKIEWEEVKKLKRTTRGHGGFGSTK